MKALNKYMPFVIFLSFVLLLIAATIHYAPSWGLMDDSQNIDFSNSIWKSKKPTALINAIAAEFNLNLYYRPFYGIWAIFAYHFFKNNPLMLYILIILLNMAGCLIWGFVFYKIFNPPERDKYLTIFIFPLSFFLFTPFWNIFMYISLPEKFIFFFTPFALYYLQKSIRAEKIKYFLLALMFVIFTILSKPTGIHNLLVTIVILAFGLILHRGKRAFFIAGLAITLEILLFYYLLVVKLGCQGYTAKYQMDYPVMKTNFLNAPAVIKLLSLIAAAQIAFLIVKIIKRQAAIERIFIPLSFLTIIIVLLPWGIFNYHIGITAPFVLGIFFPIYSSMCVKSRFSRMMAISGITCLVFIFATFIILPRISKMGDIRRVTAFMKDSHLRDNKIQYYFPPPYSESAWALSSLTGAAVNCLSRTTLEAGDLKGGRANYLILNDQAPFMQLSGVASGKEIYSNNTWRIYEIMAATGNRELLKFNYKENFLTKIKTYLREKV